jgi:tetratricopeptide (TPR) repeat protein
LARSDLPDSPFPLNWIRYFLREQFGAQRGDRLFVPVMLVLVLGSVYLAVKPFGDSLSRWLLPPHLPKATPGYFNVGIAQLVNDDEEGNQGRKLRVALQDLEGVKIAPLKDSIAIDDFTGSTFQDKKRRADESAGALLRRDGYDALIWGEVLRDPSTALQLYWTVGGRSFSSQPFQLTANQTLPPLFWDALEAVLKLVVVTAVANVENVKTPAVASNTVDRVRQLIKNPRPGQTRFAASQLRLVYAQALISLGDLSSKKDAFEEAVVISRQALAVFTPEHTPSEWGWTQNVLGVALETIGEREATNENLDGALVAYQEAQRIFPRDRLPSEWAPIQNNLGTTLKTLGDRKADLQLLKQAVAAHRAVLEVRPRSRLPFDWATSMTNLGIALTSVAEFVPPGETLATLNEARTALTQALEVFTRQDAPLMWARGQLNLSNTLLSLDHHESNSQHLADTLNAIDEALQVITKDKEPLEWGLAQTNRGEVFLRQGIRDRSAAGTEQLKKAVSALEASLSVLTPDGSIALLWALTQYRLGVALGLLGAREPPSKQIEERSATAFREALTKRTRTLVPLDWAATKNTLGMTLQQLAYMEPDTEHGRELLRDAIAAYRDALLERTPERDLGLWVETQQRLGQALNILGIRCGDTVQFEEAGAVYDDILKRVDENHESLLWARLKRDLGDALENCGERERGTLHLEKARTAYEQSLSKFSPSDNAEEYGDVVQKLERVRQLLGQRASE